MRSWRQVLLALHSRASVTREVAQASNSDMMIRANARITTLLAAVSIAVYSYRLPGWKYYDRGYFTLIRIKMPSDSVRNCGIQALFDKRQRTADRVERLRPATVRGAFTRSTLRSSNDACRTLVSRRNRSSGLYTQVFPGKPWNNPATSPTLRAVCNEFAAIIAIFGNKIDDPKDAFFLLLCSSDSQLARHCLSSLSSMLSFALSLSLSRKKPYNASYGPFTGYSLPVIP